MMLPVKAFNLVLGRAPICHFLLSLLQSKRLTDGDMHLGSRADSPRANSWVARELDVLREKALQVPDSSQVSP